MASNWVATRRKRIVLGAIDTLLWPLAALDRLRPKLLDRVPSKILVLEFWMLGDAVVAEPFLRQLRRRFPEAEISLLCKPATRTLLEPSALVDRFILADIPWTAFERKYAMRRYRDADFAGLLRRLRAERFDLTLDARMDLRSNILTRAIGARRRVGFDTAGGRSLLTDRVQPLADTSHKVEDWLALLTPFGVASQPTSPLLTVPPESTARARQTLAAAGLWVDGRALIAINPSARLPVRRWPMSRFRSLVKILAARSDVSVVVIQDPDGYGDELSDIPGVVALRIPLDQLPAQLALCDLFVGNDTGPAHIAAAVGVPCITIFGSAVSAWYRPYGEQHRVVQVDDVPCRPCFDQCTQPENFCITDISLARVLEEVESALEHVLERRRIGGASNAP